jgi:hypothetical protein
MTRMKRGAAAIVIWKTSWRSPSPPSAFGEMIVRIQWLDRTMGVPLAQLLGLGVDGETAEAIADWHYWVAQGRQF